MRRTLLVYRQPFLILNLYGFECSGIWWLRGFPMIGGRNTIGLRPTKRKHDQLCRSWTPI